MTTQVMPETTTDSRPSTTSSPTAYPVIVTTEAIETTQPVQTPTRALQLGQKLAAKTALSTPSYSATSQLCW
jgi:hypothetical protein